MALHFRQKLIIPCSVRPLVIRAELQAQLEQAITTKRVVALTASAGWGKTIALAQWATSTTLPIAWYTIDVADRDPYVFLDYLLNAAVAFVPDLADLITQLQTATVDELSALMRATALTLADASARFVLVLDDFHFLTDTALPPFHGTSLIFDLLASIAEYAGNCHLVFASRTLPALHGLVRMVAQQRAAVFDYAALQFSASDVQQLAGLAYALTLSDDSADELTAQLGGWVTGIVLSLDQSRTDDRRPTTDQSFVPQTAATQRELIAQPPVLVQADTAQVYAYFAEQIITPLPPDLRQFLEATSVLEDLSPRRCDALLGTTDSARFLDEIKRHGLFVSSRAGWLAYHSLFRDFLRARLARDPERRRALLRRAGALYRAEDDLERALDCYLAADAADEAVALLREAIPPFRRRSRQTTLLACFERLGQERALPPDLLLAQARVYGDLTLWERAYLAIQLVETIGDEAACWEARILYADLLNMQGNIARARSVLDEVVPEALPVRLQLEYHVTAGRAQVVSGEIPAAIRSLEQAHTLTTTLADSADDPSALADIYDNLGWAYAAQGDRVAALRHLKRADACWQASGNSGRRALTLNNLGTLAMEEGRYAEARAALDSGLALAQQTARRREEAWLHISLAELDILEGELEQAVARLTEAHALAVRMEVLSSVEFTAASALWAAALQGNRRAIQAWQQTLEALGTLQHSIARGRLAVAQSLLLLQQPTSDPAILADIPTVAITVEHTLLAPERACLALLQAT
ncbi:MAG TPA: transcriptional regulator, partial [Roseiflexaceae bacterium]